MCAAPISHGKTPLVPIMHEWRLSDRVLTIGPRPLVMGILNVTPDSFSDGGRFDALTAAVARGLELVEQGADILDIGGESTRPGSLPVTLEEELRRVIPVVTQLAKQIKIPISVDTSKANVARQALAVGAHIINDVTALTGDPDMAAVAQASGAGIILMHMQGTPATMQLDPSYENVVADIGRFFETRLHDVVHQGIEAERIVLDPGIGFGKKLAHNLEILARLPEFQGFGRPICLGVSRKGFIARVRNRPADQRLASSLAIVCHAQARQAVQVIRAHDVLETRDAVEMIAAIEQGKDFEGAARPAL